MRLSRILFPALIGCAMVMSAVAQDQTQAPPPGKPSAALRLNCAAESERATEPAPVARGTRVGSGGDCGAGAECLVADRVYTGSLDAGAGFQTGQGQRGFAAGDRWSERNFGPQLPLPGAVSYEPAIMDSIRQQYREAGWQHLVESTRAKGTDDRFVDSRGPCVDPRCCGAVCWSEELNFISVSGSITPLELLHLSGHFGIPKMDGGAVAPGPPGR